MMTKAVNSQDIYALVIGIEHYDDSATLPDLDGCANDAISFATWLFDQGVPSDHISLCLSSLDAGQELKLPPGISRQSARRNTIFEKLTSLTTIKEGRALFLFWAGHGVMKSNTRRLFFADATGKNPLNMNLDTELRALETDAYNGFPLQFCFVDACATPIEKIETKAMLPDNTLVSPGHMYEVGREQYVAFAAKEGEEAHLDRVQKTGHFSRELMVKLEEQTLHLDLEALNTALWARFEELRQAGRLDQTPNYYWIKGKGGSRVYDERYRSITWSQLRTSCKNITRSGMSRLPEKAYLEEIYVQRKHVYDQFMQFLKDSETQCFVLIGKSGVGKSSFLLSLAEEMQAGEALSQDNGHVMLVYDAGRRRGMSFREAIDQDFSQQLRRKIEHIWKEINKIEEINKIDGIDKYSLLLCVDAVNENERAGELVAQLSDLIWERWPWLKVLLISRPESWQKIMREVEREFPLAERAYYQEKDVTSGVSMEPLNYSMEMKPFSREELPQAYDKYQSKYKLQTPYEELPPRIQEIISDPFHLWVVAAGHEEQAIPEDLKITTLIDDYVKALISVTAPRKRRLRDKDRSWLENQLVPLMLYEEHYKSVITSEELDATNHPLFRAIRGEVDSDAQSMLQSFTNLVDVDILKREERDSGFEIAFKFVRFYEHFAGKRILRLSEAQKDRYTYFLHMIERTTGDYLLWGAVKNALVQEAEKPDIGVLLKLCRTPDQHVREMMVSVLTTLSVDARQQVERILKELVPSARQVFVINKVRQWLGKTISTRNAARIATEVASNLNMPWLLQTAALQGDSRIRAEAARFAYYLWKRDHQGGFMILEYLAQHMISGVIPDMVALEPTMALSLSILFENYRDEQVLLRLRDIVREIISGIFLTGENVSLKERIARTILTPERIFLILITVLKGFVNGLPRYGAAFTYGDLEAFFSLGDSEKALYKRLVSYIDVEGNYSKEQMERDFLTVMKQTNNYLIVFIVQLGLIAHTCYDPLTFLSFLQRFFEETKKEIAAYPYMNDVIHVLDNALHRDPMNEELFGFFISALEECHEFYIQHPEAIRNPDYRRTPEVHNLGPYIFHMYRKTGVVETVWLRTQIQNALEPLDTRFFELLLTSELTLIGIERQSPRAALLTVAMFFQFFRDGNADPSIRLEIQKFLARLKAYYPSEVDDFLGEQQAGKDTRLQIQIRESEENAGALIGQRSLYFLRDYIIMQSLPLKLYFLKVLDKAVDYTDIRIWLNYFLREVINVIYGKEILRPRK